MGNLKLLVGIIALFPVLISQASDLEPIFEWNNTIFYISQDKVDAATAAKQCAQQGYELLSIHGKKSNQAIKRLLEKHVKGTDDIWTNGRIVEEVEDADSRAKVKWGSNYKIQPYEDFAVPKQVKIAKLGQQQMPKCRKTGCEGGFCAPTCGDIPTCNITLLPCTTTTLPCDPFFPTNCSYQRGECSSTCPPCEVVNPQCSAVRGPCTVKNGNCKVIPGHCTVSRTDCVTTRPNCTTVAKPCRPSTLKPPKCNTSSNCHFLGEDRCVTTQRPCYTIPKSCTTHTSACILRNDRSGYNCGETTTTTCEPPTTICPSPVTTCKPVIGCDPIVCQSPSRLCEKPETHCPSPITICPDPVINCTENHVHCDEPIVHCPDPEIICTKPAVSCPGPDVTCPGPITYCDTHPYCPPPIVTCPEPEIVCEKPIPCDPATHPPLTNPTCPPGFEECLDCTTTPMPEVTTTKKPGGCICLNNQMRYQWEKIDCNEKKRFICMDNNDYSNFYSVLG